MDVYADADVHLLDDIISAVDAEVAKHIMEQCVFGVLAEKTVVLVTNQVHWLKECSRAGEGQIAVLGDPLEHSRGGHLAHIGSYAELQCRGVHTDQQSAFFEKQQAELGR